MAVAIGIEKSEWDEKISKKIRRCLRNGIKSGAEKTAQQHYSTSALWNYMLQR